MPGRTPTLDVANGPTATSAETPTGSAAGPTTTAGPGQSGQAPKPQTPTPTPAASSTPSPTAPPTAPVGTISGIWHYDGEAGYFVFSLAQVSGGKESYVYHEFMGDGKRSGGGTATVEGNHVRLDGNDGFGTYEWNLELTSANSMTGDKYRIQFDLTFNITLVRG